MNTAFWLFGQFEEVLLTVDQVSKVVGIKPGSIRTMAAQGKFPRARVHGKWHIEDLARHIDSAKDVPRGQEAA
jgi:predicted DNA-binding transcriptional regulator AlpA